jgi:hydroxyethylthiazole kinase
VAVGSEEDLPLDHGAACWAGLQAIRERAPLVHNITNLVAMETVANCLLALGASPAMAHAEAEVEELAAAAAALVVNIGTLEPAWVPAMHKAAGAAVRAGRPWVLDPVGAAATAHRRGVAERLAEDRPSVIRANASEVLALTGKVGEGQGVDTTHGVEEAGEAAQALARRFGCVVAITGAIDHATDGERVIEVGNGDPRMTRVTALGCAASATVGAFLAVEDDPLQAAAHGLAVFGLAGERAAARTRGPGTLKVELLNELALLDEAVLRAELRIKE